MGVLSVAQLSAMPPIIIDQSQLVPFGAAWTKADGRLPRNPPYSGALLGAMFDRAVGHALAAMLGNIPVVSPSSAYSLLPPQPNCVEVGPCRVVGGVRPQNFDVGYRPDAVRFVFDSKTLNDESSVGKNYQNMINDLATEATTVHSRFPSCLVTFIVVIPRPCLNEPQRSALIGTLERLTGRDGIDEPPHVAEAIALAVWDPSSGVIDAEVPVAASPLRVENFSARVEAVYKSRYKGLPPHAE